MPAKKPGAAILASQAHLARIAGVDRQRVQYQVTKGELREAFVGPPNRRRIDLRHPAVHGWLRGMGIDPQDVPEIVAAQRADGEQQQHGARPLHEPADVAELLDMTLGDILLGHEGIGDFDSWLKRRRRIGEIRKIELTNAVQEGKLVERDYIATHVFGNLDAMQRQMLSEAAKTLASEMYTACKAGRPIEDATKSARAVFTKYFERARKQALKALRP